MSVYVIASKTEKDLETRAPLYWNVANRSWVPQSLATQFNDAAREAFKVMVSDGQWELFSDGSEQYRASCPRCQHPVFEEVQVDVTVSTEFTSMQLHTEEDFLEPDYGESENHGGVIDRYQCANCGHVVAKTPTEFREWVKQHGVKQ